MENLKQGAQYQWAQDATFSLSAEQFGILYNSLSTMIGTDTFKAKVETARETLGILQLQQVMTDVLSNAVSTGTASEISSDATSDTPAE